ncbi:MULTISPECIES: cytochrome c oxidase assembly protein [unclassified Microbacterium]|uniref:cytochrome c oxidase assembly protein n=1 Tax=unclassified Microbacterium TaxID=2609290 RepID=UPI00386C40FA
MMDQHGHGAGGGMLTLALLVPFAVALAAYLGAAIQDRRRDRGWPLWRMATWSLGIAIAAAGFVGPLADLAHDSVAAHMTVHVLTGMAAPLLLVVSAPITLALRALAVTPARRLSRLLRSRLVRVAGHPVTAAMLTVGGLWALHRTPLGEALGAAPLGHTVMSLHFLASGFLFTAAIVPVDPAPHRASLAVRAVVLWAAVAAHGILAKLIYVDAPTGAVAADARVGAEIMFYGGDLVDGVLIVLLCAEWYRVTGRRHVRAETRPRATGALA